MVKCSKKKAVGAKLRRKIYRQKDAPIDNNLAMKSIQYQKDTCEGKLKFYAFPSFNVSDTMLFLPSAMAAFVNSADSNSLAKLLLSHFDKECEVKISLLQGHVINTRRFLKFYAIMADLRPDFIMCVHSSKMVDNQLCASIYVKFTDCKIIYDSVARSVTDPVFRTMFNPQHAHRLNYQAKINRMLSAEQEDGLAKLVHDDEDVLVYVHLDMKLTIDDTSKKVTHYEVEGHVTSIQPVEALCVDSENEL